MRIESCGKNLGDLFLKVLRFRVLFMRIEKFCGKDVGDLVESFRV